MRLFETYFIMIKNICNKDNTKLTESKKAIEDLKAIERTLELLPMRAVIENQITLVEIDKLKNIITAHLTLLG